MIEIEDGSRWEDADQDVWRYNAATGLFEGVTTGLLDRDLAELVASFGPITCQKTGKKIFPTDPDVLVDSKAAPGDSVSHPSHYTSHPSGVECIDITRHMGFLDGNAMKYLWRYSLKGGVEDLKKCRQYLDWLIEKESA